MAKEIRQEYHNNADKSGINANSKWWLTPEGKHYEDIWAVYRRIQQYQSYRTANNIKFAQLYCNQEIMGLRAGQFQSVVDPRSFLKNRVTYNVIKSAIDSVTAKISKIKPRPVYITDNSPWGLQQKAERLNQFILGCFQSIGTGSGPDRTMWGLGTQGFRDSCISGLGVTQFSTEGNKVIAERRLSDEIIVDETEGMYRQPRTLHSLRFIGREILLDKYPKKAFQIKAAPNPLLIAGGNQNSVADVVATLESWHLPSGEEQTDGLHVVSIENADLAQEEWELDFLPFLFQRWSLRPLGFDGQGLAEELIGIQLEINKILRNIQISQNLCSVPQTWLDYLSKTVTKNMNNTIGGIRYYQGRPPVQTVPQAMSQEVYNHLERLYERAFQIAGVSLMSATSTKPAGLDSAVAQREYKDTETERFSVQSDEYDNFFVEAAEMTRKLCKKLAKEGKQPVVNFRDGNSLKELTFADVDIPEEKIMITPSPSQLLPKEPAGRLATVKELTNDGFYDKDEALELLDFPDTKKVNNLKLAGRRDCMKVIETMIEKNKFIPPEPYMNLELAASMAQSYYLNGKCDNMPEDRLQLLRDFMDAVDDLKRKRDEEAKRAQMEAQQPPEMQMAPPPAQEAALPPAPMPLPDMNQQPAIEQQAV